MKATITFEIDADDVCKILDKIHQQHKEDQKEWEENPPTVPVPGWVRDEPIVGTAEAFPFEKKKSKPN